MVVSYYRRRSMRSELKDPSEVASVKAIYDANQGIGSGEADERERVARLLGFNVLYASVMNEGIWEMLHNGPIIYAGAWPGETYGHWVVITGISENTVYINNPSTGAESYSYDYFVSQILLQTAERPLIY
jgi:ABC-type bacteriocin/lantibiotic exporter with double-glycine peptidase domain